MSGRLQRLMDMQFVFVIIAQQALRHSCLIFPGCAHWAASKLLYSLGVEHKLPHPCALTQGYSDALAAQTACACNLIDFESMKRLLHVT
eukprot:3609184-Amphidinium_carterae.1